MDTVLTVTNPFSGEDDIIQTITTFPLNDDYKYLLRSINDMKDSPSPNIDNRNEIKPILTCQGVLYMSKCSHQHKLRH